MQCFLCMQIWWNENNVKDALWSSDRSYDYCRTRISIQTFSTRSFRSSPTGPRGHVPGLKCNTTSVFDNSSKSLAQCPCCTKSMQSLLRYSTMVTRVGVLDPLATGTKPSYPTEQTSHAMAQMNRPACTREGLDFTATNFTAGEILAILYFAI